MRRRQNEVTPSPPSSPLGHLPNRGGTAVILLLRKLSRLLRPKHSCDTRVALPDPHQDSHKFTRGLEPPV